jgi:hypothetical protein
MLFSPASLPRALLLLTLRSFSQSERVALLPSRSGWKEKETCSRSGVRPGQKNPDRAEGVGPKGRVSGPGENRLSRREFPVYKEKGVCYIPESSNLFIHRLGSVYVKDVAREFFEAARGKQTGIGMSHCAIGEGVNGKNIRRYFEVPRDQGFVGVMSLECEAPGGWSWKDLSGGYGRFGKIGISPKIWIPEGGGLAYGVESSEGLFIHLALRG